MNERSSPDSARVRVARALCRQYEIDDGFSEEQADRAAASDMHRNFLNAADAAIAACGGVAQPSFSLCPPSPDFRVVPVRVLQSAYDRIDALLANIETDLREANSVRIELRHLINERYSLPSTQSEPGK